MTGPVPLVLLPGMNCSSRLWHSTLRSASLERCEVDVLQPGLSGSSVDACVERLLDMLPARFALAGLSLGAIVAMALVRHAPERVERLALLAVNPRAPVAAQYEAWTSQRRALAGGRSARDLQRDLLPVLLSPSARSEAMEEEVLLMGAETGEQDLDDQLALQASRIDERPTLSRIRVPTTVVAGGSDALCGLDRHEEVRARVPGSRLVVLPGVGHLSPLEAPDQVAAALAAWWHERSR